MKDDSTLAGDHLSLEDLLALSLDELPEDAAAVARDHLLHCATCLAQARSILNFPDAPPEVSAAERNAAWQRLRKDIGTPEVIPFPARPQPKRPWLLPAAAFLLAGVGIGYLLSRASLPASDPRITLASFNQVLPHNFSVLGTAASPPAILCPSEGDSVVWTLGGLEADAQARLEVEIEDPEGDKSKLEGQTTRFGEMVILVPAALVVPGEWRLVVRRPGHEAVVAEYLLNVHCP